MFTTQLAKVQYDAVFVKIVSDAWQFEILTGTKLVKI
jgi:hypothetical protein